MQALMKLRDMLMDELEEITERGPLTESSLGIVQKLTHSIKSIDTICAMEEQSRESRESRDGYSGRRYRDGSQDGSRESRDYSGRRYRDGGTSGRRRDSMGRFRDGGSSGRRYSRDEARDKMISGLEEMMPEVSPEAQRAIEKTISALEQE